MPVIYVSGCFLRLVRAKHEPFAWASLGWADLASGEEDDIVSAKDETERGLAVA